MSELKTLIRTIVHTNEAKCLLCNDVIESTNRHDFRSCRCGNLAVDGGHSYLRRAIREGWDTMQEMSDTTEEEYAPDWLQDGYVHDYSKRQIDND